jgi:hypothetical protein
LVTCAIHPDLAEEYGEPDHDARLYAHEFDHVGSEWPLIVVLDLAEEPALRTQS